MKRGKFWLIGLLAIIGILVSCAPAPSTQTPAAPTTPTPTPAAATTPTPATKPAEYKNWWDETPKYGGIINQRGGATAISWDVFGRASNIQTAFHEALLIKDWYLPLSESPCINWYEGNPKVLTGWLAESWEMTDPQTWVFRIRKGIKFWNKAPVNGRELVAADVKWSYEQTQASKLAGKGLWGELIDKITCPDKYTVVFHFNQPRSPDSIEMFQGNSSAGGLVVPHEVVDVYGKDGFVNWKNHVGTGPFIVTDDIVGSCTTMIRNPDYWGYDRKYPENKLPYVDGRRVVAIADASTAVAALRTGKIDAGSTTWDEVESLSKTTPWLKYRIYESSGASLIAYPVNKKPFDNVKVRQACQMAIDQEGIKKGIYRGNCADAYAHWPYMKGAGCYLEINDYPQIVKDMFTRNVTKAKQLLADAGYPNGFKTEIICASADADMTSLVKDYLKDIGVDAQIKVMESAAYQAIMLDHSFPGLYVHGITAGQRTMNQRSPAVAIGTRFLMPSNYDIGGYDNPWLVQTFEKAQQTWDYDARMKLYKDMGIRVMEDAVYMLLPTAYVNAFWAPWVKGGYIGQTGQSGQTWYDNNSEKYWWIDRELKKSTIGSE